MKALRYTKRLISFDSTSHKSNALISKYLEMKMDKHGFVVERLEYKDEKNVKKVCLVGKKGKGEGGLAYFGHSDVVPAEKWFSKRFGPFQAAVARERVYGRGSCDMKGSIACMLAASQLFQRDELKRPLYFVVTADEEIGYHGIEHVVNESKLYREMVEGKVKAIVGEPTLLEVVYAHKGTYLIKAVSKGKSAHSSTAHGINANHKMIPFLVEAKKIFDETQSDSVWHNQLFDPPTLSMNIGVNDYNRAVNITSRKSVCTIYIRPMTGISIDGIIDRLTKVANTNDLKIKVDKRGEPMMVDPESQFVQTALKIAHRPKAKTVSYGTDGGALTEIEDKIVFGPGNIAQAHTNNEWIAIEQLSLGTEAYAKFIKKFCCED